MRLVENADGEQEQAGLRVGVVVQCVFDIGLLEFDLARLAVAGQ